MKKSEKSIEKNIKNYLTDKGAYFEKIHGGDIFQSSGIPDILACLNGRFIAIEVKKEAGGKLSALQHFKLKQITEAGGVAIVARSLQEVQERLKREGIV